LQLQDPTSILPNPNEASYNFRLAPLHPNTLVLPYLCMLTQ
jgi:hypothetical protein